MANSLVNLDVEFVSLVDRAAVRDPTAPTQPQRFVVFKRDRGAQPTPKEDPMTPTPEEQAAALEKAQAELAETLAKLEKSEADKARAEAELAEKNKPADPPEPKKVDKSALAPEVREMIEKAEREAEQLRKDHAEDRARLEKAEQLAKEERDLRVEREFIAKAEKEFPHIGAAGELGPRLKRMSESLSKEDYDAHLQQLAATNAQLETGALFSELGKSGDPQAGGQDADMAKLQKAAEEIRKADSSLSNYEAMELALRQDKAAQARYLANNR